MKPTKEIKQRSTALAEPELLPFEEVREWLQGIRPYNVAWQASEVIGQIHEYTRNGTLDKRYAHFFINIHWELENMLDSGVLGYLNGDPPYKAEDESPSAR